MPQGRTPFSSNRTPRPMRNDAALETPDEDFVLRSHPGGLLGLYFKAMVVCAGVGTALIVGIMLVQIVARYGLNASLIWAEELCRYILIWQTFLLIGIAYHQGELAILDILDKRVGPRVRFLIRFVVYIPVLFFLHLLIKHGIVHAERFSRQTIPAIDFLWTSLTGEPAGLTVFWIYVAVPVGCFILVGHLLLGLVDEARRAFFSSAKA
jgi:TRAP-type C4-dicarboxylate transport system permease small subunit